MRKITLVLIIIPALLLAVLGATVGTLTVNSTTRTLVATKELVQSDADTLALQAGIFKPSSNATSTGDTCPGVEAATSNPAVQNTISKTNWSYNMTITEVAGTSWPAGRKYKAELYTDGTLRATRYFQNATSAAGVEGVSFKVDLGTGGTNLPDSYTTVVTLVAAC